MDFKAFSITKAVNDEYRIAPDNLSTTLTDWKLIADQFYRSSEIIFLQCQKDNTINAGDENISRPYTPDLSTLYFFLIGMCLENMIKGILVHQDPNLVKGSQLKGKIKTHNLKLLANNIVGCSFTDEEKQLFEFLTEHTIWISKYPIPANADVFFEGMVYQIEIVREVFLSVYNKQSRIMEATSDLVPHLHNYQFSPYK